MIRTASLFFLAILVSADPVFTQPLLSKSRWLEDLSFLKTAIYEKHIDPFWKNPKSVFDSLFSQAKAEIENGDETFIKSGVPLTRFTQILALTADGHSGVSTQSRAEMFGLYNYSVAWFPEGLFVVRTDEDHKQILGARIVKIDDVPIEEVKKKLISVSASFHDQGFKRFSPRYIESPGILYGLGIAKNNQQVSLTVQKTDDATTTFVFNKQSLKDQEKTKMIQLSEVSGAPIPLYRQNTNKNYWFKYLPEEKMMYVNFIQVQNSKEEPMDAFVKRLSEDMADKEVDKFVVDLRLNPGGDQFTAWPLLGFIMSNAKINRHGKLFVVTSHNTFSAATAFLEAMESKTECIIAGTAPSDSPRYPAEDNVFVLPNSHMQVRLSTEMWNYSFDHDTRNIIEPGLPVVTSFNDFLKGADPVLEAIIQYKPSGAPPRIPVAENVAGRYLFGIDKALEIKIENGGMFAYIPGRLHTLLTPVDASTFTSGINGMNFTFNKEGVLVHFPGGTSLQLRRMDKGEQTALDLLLSGKYENALDAYKDLQRKFPGDININGTNLAGLGFYLILETRNFEMGKALIEIAIQLDPRSKVAKNLLQGVISFKH